ncbi:LOW QUALITY PROTEIN: PEX30 Peroxisomal membrane protein PEX30 [Candida maltosa Xu316]
MSKLDTGVSTNKTPTVKISEEEATQVTTPQRPIVDEPANTTDTSSSTGELRASFTNDKLQTKPQSSPLLSSTPPSVSKALVKSYPYLIIINKILSIVTWTNDDYWVNVVLLSLYSLAVLYFENLVTWSGHLLLVALVIFYALLNNKIIEQANLHPTLDDVVQALTSTCIKADLFLSPITSLSLTAYDIKRLLFTTLFLTPLYLILTLLLIKPRTILLFSGIYLLTYHSSYSIVTRRILWKLKIVRLIFFYLTGLDLSKTKNHSLFAAAFAKVSSSNKSTKPVRFTYVIYENQRKWLGVGWTSNLLTTPWTDEFLNESSSIDAFKLPNALDEVSSTQNENSTIENKIQGATWRWVDKTWRLDSTNDGAITLPSSKRSKTTANPTADEGFLYYDNTWKKPATEDTFSKYTRRRRWIRTAELIFDDNKLEESLETSDDVKTTGANIQDTTAKKVKNLRFVEEEEQEQEEEKEVTVESSSADKKND